MKVIKKTIELNAPAQKIWDVLLLDEYNRQWFAVFSEGTRAETDWAVGSKVIFVDESQGGMLGRIITHDVAKKLVVEYDGFMAAGKEDRESEGAKEFAGAHESYELTEDNGVITLHISSDMSDEYYDMMAAQWDKALLVIKQLAEN